MYWSSIEKSCRSGMACSSVIAYGFLPIFHVTELRLMCIFYSTDLPSFKCVHLSTWIFMYYDVNLTVVFFMEMDSAAFEELLHVTSVSSRLSGSFYLHL